MNPAERGTDAASRPATGRAPASAVKWLNDHMAGVPFSLRARMVQAVDGVDAAADATVPHVLGEAALSCLRAAMPLCDQRAAALHLLAADALITYACEAAVDEHSAPADLPALCEAFAPGRLAGAMAGT